MSDYQVIKREKGPDVDRLPYWDVVIIGAGPAGLAAGLTTAHRGLTTLVIEAKDQPGGQPQFLYPDKQIVDIPGFPDGITGEELSRRTFRQAQDAFVQFQFQEELLAIEDTTRVEIDPLKSVVTNKNSYLCRKAILACGLLHYPRRLPILDRLECPRVYYRIPRAQEYQASRVLVIGGGDSALDAALMVLGRGGQVDLVVRGKAVAGRADALERVISSGGIVHTSTEVTGAELTGEQIVYDSKKAGSITVSHLRFSPQPIEAPYLITRANFVACHQFGFLDRIDVLETAEPGATFLLNSHYGPDEVWHKVPGNIQEQIIKKRLRFFVVDAYRLASEAGLGQRINTVMQTCFFALANIMPGEHAIREIKSAIEESYGKRGQSVLRRNFAAVDSALESLHEVAIPEVFTGERKRLPAIPAGGSDFIERVTAVILAGKGDLVPVSALPFDGTFPTGTARLEKRSIAQDIPIWDADICIQCGLCSLVCPHAMIRIKVYEPSALAGARRAFARGRGQARISPGSS